MNKTKNDIYIIWIPEDFVKYTAQLEMIAKQINRLNETFDDNLKFIFLPDNFTITPLYNYNGVNDK